MPTVTLMLRIRNASGDRAFCKPVTSANGKLRPLFALVNGNPEHHPEGVYNLRYERAGKRVWETCGNDPQLALTAKLRREHLIKSEELGLAVPDRKPEVATEAPKRLIAECVTEYLNEVAERRSLKTASGYKYDLTVFQEFCPKVYMEDVGRADMMVFMAKLKQKGNAPRTVFNRVCWISTFFRHFGYESPLPKKDIPKFTVKVAAAYNRDELKALFAAATHEERMAYQFFLGTGAREQEVMYACWSDIDFVSGIFNIRAKPDLNWTLKDNEERSVPLPDKLIADLKARRQANPNARFIFTADKGGLEGHFLRKLKNIALKAGLNCGSCVNKKGLKCDEYGVCKSWELHKYRKTFAFMHHGSGVSARTLMDWLGHADLETTLAYLAVADVRSVQTRTQVNRTFEEFA